MCPTTLRLLLALGLVVHALVTPAAAADSALFPETPPTLEAFRAMAPTRLLGARSLSCPQGEALLVEFGAAEDPADLAWRVWLLSWRAGPYMVFHYTPGPDGFAHRAWVDQFGTGEYTRYTAEDPEAMLAQLQTAGVLRSPCAVDAPTAQPGRLTL